MGLVNCHLSFCESPDIKRGAKVGLGLVSTTDTLHTTHTMGNTAINKGGVGDHLEKENTRLYKGVFKQSLQKNPIRYANRKLLITEHML